MKTGAIAFVGALFAMTGSPAAPAASASAASQFITISPDYKKPQIVPETLFNPFHAPSAAESGQRKDGGFVSNDSVANAIEHRGVSGILLGPRPHTGRVIIGDQVFAVGDDLEFPDEAKGEMAPLIPGSNIVLREVSRENLVFEIAVEGEAPRPLTFSLRKFWRP